MTCIQTPPRLRRSLVLTGHDPTFFPASDWMVATGISAVDFLLDLQSLVGYGEIKPGIQAAKARTDKPEPGAPIRAGGFEHTKKLHQFREVPDLSAAAFVRFGFVGRIRTDSCGQSAVEAQMDVAVRSCGEVLGTRTVEIQPFSAAEGQPAVVPLTDWSPTVGVGGLKTVFVVIDNQEQALEYQLVVRTAKDRMAPGPWASVEGKRWHNPGPGNSEHNTGELAIPKAAAFDEASAFQLGIAYRKAKGSKVSPRCVLHTLTHCRYA